MLGVVRDLEVVRAEEEGERAVAVAATPGGAGAMGRRGGAKEEVVVQKPVLKLRPGYMYREANWEIGRAAERAKVKVRAFKPGDRFTAWRKTVARKARNAERRGLRKK